MHKGELFGERGLASDWAATRAQVENGYGMWLHFLKAAGVLELHERPAARLNQARLTAYVAHLRTRLTPVSVASRLRDLAEALRVWTPLGSQFGAERTAAAGGDCSTVPRQTQVSNGTG